MKDSMALILIFTLTAQLVMININLSQIKIHLKEIAVYQEK